MCVCLDGLSGLSLCSSGWPGVKKEDSKATGLLVAMGTQFSCLTTQTEGSFSDRSVSAGIKDVLSSLPWFFGTRGSAIHQVVRLALNLRPSSRLSFTLCSSGRPITPIDLPISASAVLRIKACATTPSLRKGFLKRFNTHRDGDRS